MRPAARALLLFGLLTGLGCETHVQLAEDPGCGGSCTGCCNAGVCVPFASQRDTACGTNGAICSPCSGGGTCANGVCVGGSGCNGTNCAGCCQGNQCVLLSQQSASACGKGGAACGSCPGVCSNGACQSNSTCGVCAGCCSGIFCEPGNMEGACGKGGAVCQSCASNELCTAQTCTRCTVANCPAGCCDSFGTCLAGDSILECGTGGVSCRLCPAGTQCVGKACR